MKKLLIIFSVFFALLLREECHGQSGSVRYTAGINYTVGVPTFVPQGNVSKVAIDTGTMKWYEYAQVGGWRWSGDRVQDISGCAAPAYTPGKAQSRLVLNACTEEQNGHGPELYKYTGSAWLCLNCGGNYTAGTGIDITGDVITNTGDLSNTNELQTLSVSGNDLTISDGNTVTLPTPSSTLDGLTDVTITAPSNNQILQYNTAGSQWVNATLSAITGSGTQYSFPYFNTTGTIAAHTKFVTNSAGTRVGFGFAEANNAITISSIGTNSSTWALKVYDPSYNLRGGFRDDGAFIVGPSGIELYTNGDARFRNPTTDNYIRFRTDLASPEINAYTFLGTSKALYIQTGNTNLSIGSSIPTDKVTVDGVNGYSVFRIIDTYTPTGTADTNGNTGSFAWDANFLYIKTAAGWKRTALSTF